MRTTILATVVAALALMSGPAALAKDKLPETTPEGLKLQKHTKLDVVYMADDVDLSQYTKVALIDCYVAFKKDWQKHYNQQERELSRKITDDDMTKMRTEFADEFKKIFTDVLQDKHGYEVVDHTGAEVLVIRPGLIEIDVTAPSASTMHSASMSRTYAASPGQMTLYMELYDSVSNELLAKVMDTKGGRNTPGFAMSSSKASNIAAADRALRSWAELLSKQLGEIVPPPKGDDDS